MAPSWGSQHVLSVAAVTVLGMPMYRVTYRPDAGLPPELVETDRVSVEPAGLVVMHRSVLVIGSPREVVVRRFSGAQVLDVAEVIPRG